METTEYLIKYDDFHGPANLLLDLVRKRKLDIYQIKLSLIIQDFLDFIKKNRNILLNTISGFLYIASILVEMKSSSVIPSQSKSEEEEADIVDAKILSRREEIYRTYRKISNYLCRLKEMEELYYVREAPVENEFMEILPDFTENLNVEQICCLASTLLKKNDFTIDLSQIYVEDASITLIDAIENIKSLIDRKKKVTFREIADQYDLLVDKIICFLSILELYKNEMIDIVQFENFGDIIIKNLKN